MKSTISTTLLMFLYFFIATGIIYPVVCTLIAQSLFPAQANGSLIVELPGGDIRGSTLVGQKFNAMGYFWGRPSSTGESSYNATLSGGSNLSLTNPEFKTRVSDHIHKLRSSHGGQESKRQIPIDLVTASASGLDPHISIAAAEYQMGRVAEARGMKLDEMKKFLERHKEGPSLGLFGESRINVLRVNLELDRLFRCDAR